MNTKANSSRLIAILQMTLSVLAAGFAGSKEVGDAIYHRGDDKSDLVGVVRTGSTAWGLNRQYYFGTLDLNLVGWILDGEEPVVPGQTQHPGHAMLYIGTDEDGNDWIAEAPGSGLSRLSMLQSSYPGHHETFRSTANLGKETRKNIVTAANEQVGLPYPRPTSATDLPTIDQQKGKAAWNGQTGVTCVGLVESSFEEASLNVTPDGHGRDFVRDGEPLYKVENWTEAEGSYVSYLGGGLNAVMQFVADVPEAEAWVFFPYTQVHVQKHKLGLLSFTNQDTVRMKPNESTAPQIDEIFPESAYIVGDESVLKVGCKTSDGDHGSGIFRVVVDISGPDEFSLEKKLYTYNEGDLESPKEVNLGGKMQPVFWYENDSVPVELDEYSFELDLEDLSAGTYEVSITSYDRTGEMTTMDSSFVIPTALDLMFVIDTTGSMADDIAQVKANIRNIVSETTAKIPDARFGVVEYRDGDSDAFAARTVVSLTDDVSTIEAGVNSLGASGGGDFEEFMLSGIAHALDGDAGLWRCKPVEKAIIVMADAPAKDPEPGTGFTKSGLAARANSGDFANDCESPDKGVRNKGGGAPDPGVIDIYGLVIGSDSGAASDLGTLAEDTGGAVASAADASEVVEAILDLIDTIGGGGGVATITGEGPLELNLQTGLYEQRVTLSNTSGSAIDNARVLVEGLAGAISLFNATGATGDGVAFVQLGAPLAPGEDAVLVMEYFSPDLSLPAPTLTAAAGEVIDPPLPGGDLPFAIDRIESLGPDGVLIEFPAVLGRTYLIQYQKQGEGTWTTVTPAIVASGNRVQWIDNGPPKTRSHPSAEEGRLYRAVVPAN